MSLTLIVYFLVLILLGYILYLVYSKKVGYIYEKYLSVGMMFIFLWVLFYIFLFLFKSDSGFDVYRVRVLYALGVLVLYTMLGFFYFYGIYNKKSTQKQTYFHIIFGVFLSSITVLTMFTSKIVIDIEYDNITGISRDVLGSWYGLISGLNALSLMLLIGIIIYRSSRLSGLSKLRYRNIAFGYSITMFLMVFFLSIMPIFDIWVFEQEQILFFIPFLIGILYSMYRYRFKKISFGLGRIFIFLFSLALTLFFVFATKKIFEFIDISFIYFWNISNNISIGDIILANTIFYVIHSYFQEQFQLHYNSSFHLQNHLNDMKSRIPFLQDHHQLTDFLSQEFSDKLNIKNTEFYPKERLSKLSEVTDFLSRDDSFGFFLNDIVFIEENRHKLNISTVMQQLEDKYVLYIPIYKQKDNILGILAIGKKSFNDYYQAFEIEQFEQFASFLTGHVTYMNIYSKIYELNLTLDKRVDEKTIEYNNLINRQKEFISYVGHEIRNPITNTIFLCYDLQKNIQDAVNKDKLSKNIKEDIDILSDELKKVGDLSKSIFDAQKFDLGKVKLYKKSIGLKEFLLGEISILESRYPNIIFNNDISDVGSFDIDEIQFRQVIVNLLGNAIKFAANRKGQIITKLGYLDDKIQITIEDNGKGFSQLNNTNIFDKYRTGDHESSGLGMGLYLCKKIIELHDGTIKSERGKELGGAKFTIIL